MKGTNTGRKVAIATGAGVAGVILAGVFFWKDLAVNYYTAKLRSGDALQRVGAVKSLQRLGHRALPGLLLALRSDDPRVQRAATIAIPAIQPYEKSTIDHLTILLKAERPEVRAAAATTVGRLGREAKDVVPQLLLAASDPDSKVRASANFALCAIEPQEADSIPAFKAGAQ